MRAVSGSPIGIAASPAARMGSRTLTEHALHCTEQAEHCGWSPVHRDWSPMVGGPRPGPPQCGLWISLDDAMTAGRPKDDDGSGAAPAKAAAHLPLCPPMPI